MTTIDILIRDLAKFCHDNPNTRDIEDAIRDLVKRVRVEFASIPHHTGTDLPPPKNRWAWEHSAEVLVYYCSDTDIRARFGIAYYHYHPPFCDPGWIDHDHPGRTPLYWWTLPEVPEEET